MLVRLFYIPIACLFLIAIGMPGTPVKAASSAASGTAVLSNEYVELSLGVSSAGVPIIAGAQEVKTGNALFDDLGLPDNLSDWVPPSLITDPTADPAVASWTISDDSDFHVAKASRGLGGGMQITWVAELAKKSSLCRLHVTLTNAGNSGAPVNWFPSWNASWQLPGAATSLRWWDAITYVPHEKTLGPTEAIAFSNQSYSAADGGTEPFWVVQVPWGSLYFGIGWSGGWNANLSFSGTQMSFAVMLPQSETQLVLKPGESIEGPYLEITPVRKTDESSARRVWMYQRAAISKGPAPAFPLIYNHWFAVNTAVDGKFLLKQTSAMAPYNFDNFIVDAGWYNEPGSWMASAKKFEPGQLESLLAGIKASGLKAGLWSAPQWISIHLQDVPGKLENPSVYLKFLRADLLDLWDSNYPGFVTDHVQSLRQNFSVDYWKYDQPIFTTDSKAGAMRNVIAFQAALGAVRDANSDLSIENCEDGGHLVNEFTLTNTQFSWLADTRVSGFADAQQNVSTTLGALDFVFPWSAIRFTNVFDQMNQKNAELTRYYCRSAMMGVWGISTDLTKVSSLQQTVILNEIANYRRLNEIKEAAFYDLVQPSDTASGVGVTFYGRRGDRAAIVAFRWNSQGPFVYQTSLLGLDPSKSYTVSDVDTGATSTSSGADLAQNGLPVTFSSIRMSALVFIDPVSQ
ncbi:MAG TPA: alpha-galactosidase [Blastocatellia bacterium]